MDKIIAIDFDGTLCRNSWPDIGPPVPEVIRRAKAEQSAGARLILWTCREGAALDRAVEWCREQGLEFDAVNDNIPETRAVFQTNPRKVGATEYWDDKNVPLTLPSCDNCAALHHTNSTKHRVYPGCANSCKNYRAKLG